MPVPKRKRSRARRDKRFANKGMVYNAAIVCPQDDCKAPIQRHSACKTCGFYNGRKVLTTKTDRSAVRDTKKTKTADAKKVSKEPVKDGSGIEQAT